MSNVGGCAREEEAGKGWRAGAAAIVHKGQALVDEADRDVTLGNVCIPLYPGERQVYRNGNVLLISN